MSFPSELYNYSTNVLLQLLDVYYVKTHDGRNYSTRDRNITDFIKKWLEPETKNLADPSLEPIQSIKQGRPFNINNAVNKDVIDNIFEDRIPLASSILEDFSKYPMKRAFSNYDPWNLLQGYIRSEDKDKYFYQITSEKPSNFLNHTEKIFYLTRGYGRPNKNISVEDFKLRTFYMNASNTALIALSDILSICPTRQNPNFVKERLSDIDLLSIGRYHNDIIAEITDCLGTSNICSSYISTIQSPFNSPGNFNQLEQYKYQGQCDDFKVNCFKQVLNKLGILPIFDFDPSTNCFISNLSQLELYRYVQPNKRWSYDEVKNLPNVYIESYVKSLPDLEILNISTPNGFKFSSTVDLSNLLFRLRSKLQNQAILFLTTPRYFLNTDLIYYGRLVDDTMVNFTLNELLTSIKQHSALIDPKGNVMSVETAEMLNNTIKSNILTDVIYKTKTRILENNSIILNMRPEEKDNLRKTFNEIDIQELYNVLQNTSAENLILWSKQISWVGTSLTFSDYFRYWNPRYKNLITDTLQYYNEIL